MTRRFKRLALAGAILLLVGSSSLAGEFRFTNVSEAAGIDFRHSDGRIGERYFIETIGSGVGLFDYDRDGWLDVYLVNAGDPPFRSDRDATKGRNRLYRNNRDGTFRDVTEQAGVGDTGYGVGVAVGDFDNDGWPDLFVTNYGENVLYQNLGDGTFRDVTREAGLSDLRWNSSAAFGDIDNDGDLDLYVVAYCKWDLMTHRTCEEQGIQVYCGPEEYEGDADRLFRNNGDGTFTDITREAGVYRPEGKGLGVIFSDFDDDGDQDIYVANDGTPNYLFVNDGTGHFEEVAWMVGVDGDDSGNPQGSMGVAFGDFNRDGHLDLVATNYQRQYNSIYRNDGDGFFTDVSFMMGLGSSLPQVSWGTTFFDADNDAWLDLFITNGHIQDRIEAYDPTSTFAQRNRLYRNVNGERFEDVTDRAGPGLKVVKVGRGAAFGDIDNDGDVDIVINNANDAPDLLRNDSDTGNYLLVETVGTKSNRDGIGARVVATVDDVPHVGEVHSGGSYASQSDFRVHFGLGEATVVERLEVRWPSGIVDLFQNVPANQILRVTEGQALDPDAR